MAFSFLSFAEAFRAHVMPELRVLADHHGWLMEIDEETFQEAFSAVMAVAVKRGAGHLSHAHFDMLDDWISTSLLETAAFHEERMAPRREIANRVFREIQQWEATVRLMLDMGVVRGQ